MALLKTYQEKLSNVTNNTVQDSQLNTTNNNFKNQSINTSILVVPDESKINQLEVSIYFITVAHNVV